MPLEILDKDFLNNINIIKIKNTIAQAKINYSVPMLKFKDEKVVSLPINLNLDKADLHAYISA
jgi:hypothetical protein